MRSEGDTVGMGDQIVLESKRFPNLGIHLTQGMWHVDLIRNANKYIRSGE